MLNEDLENIDKNPIDLSNQGRQFFHLKINLGHLTPRQNSIFYANENSVTKFLTIVLHYFRKTRWNVLLIGHHLVSNIHQKIITLQSIKSQIQN